LTQIIIAQALFQFEEQWMDAAEFFKTKTPASVFILDDGPSGCKRSSIIRIRNEKKGMVSKSVETFTKPATMATPASLRNASHRPPATPTAPAPRRASARMGVATAVRTTTFAAPSAAVTTRRQTLTGIRTTPQHTTRRPPPPAAPKPEAPITPKIVVDSSDLEPPSDSPKAGARSSRLLSDRRHDRPAVARRHETDEEKTLRKSKRIEGRRHLTIGYDGEVRSPFRERQNVMATVQRSKSAQTPKAALLPRKKPADDFDDVFHPEPTAVSRSR
jgi:hypothetical protein